MDAPALQLYRGEECIAGNLPVRGISWVLRWAAIGSMLCLSAAILAGFVYQLRVERLLERAAAAGLREAVLPHATSRSVAAAVRRRLAGDRGLEHSTSIALTINGWQVSGAVRFETGDHIAVALAIPAAVSLPDWLRRILPWQERAAIATVAEQRVGQSL
jgi:hypothetical protein